MKRLNILHDQLRCTSKHCFIYLCKDKPVIKCLLFVSELYHAAHYVTTVLAHKVQISENIHDMEGCNDMLMTFSFFHCYVKADKRPRGVINLVFQKEVGSKLSFER